MHIEFLVKSEYCFQHKNQSKGQQARKLDEETGLRITFAAEHHRQSKARNHHGRNVIDDLVDEFHVRFYNAKKNADKSNKRHCNDTQKEIQNDAEFIKSGVVVLLVLTNKNQAEQEEHQQDRHKNDHIIRFVSNSREGEAIFDGLRISKINNLDAIYPHLR